MSKQKKIKNIEIKKKIINHLIISGKKNKSEKILSQSMKILQTISKKSSQKLTCLALTSSTPIFKLNIITPKKKKKQKSKIIPAFIFNKTSRVSFAVKFIVKIAHTHAQKSFLNKITKEILFSAQNNSETIELKKRIQNNVLLNRHLFRYYRWH